MTGTTVVHIESAWNDETRGRALRLAEYESDRCQCGSGLSIADCTKDQPFLVEHIVHYGRRALDKVKAADEADADHRKLPTGWNDGWLYYVSPHDPEQAKKERRPGGD